LQNKPVPAEHCWKNSTCAELPKTLDKNIRNINQLDILKDD
jgi:hypothetical protein